MASLALPYMDEWVDRALQIDDELDQYLFANIKTTPDYFNDFERCADDVSAVFHADPDALKARLHGQISSYRSLVIPFGYYQFIRDLHAQAYGLFCQKTAKDWNLFQEWSRMAQAYIQAEQIENSKERENASSLWIDVHGLMTPFAQSCAKEIGLDLDRVLSLGNAISESMSEAATQILGLRDYKSVRFLGFETDRHKARDQVRTLPNGKRIHELSVEKDDKGPYCYIGDRNVLCWDLRQLVNVLFHEAHHGVQNYFFIEKKGSPNVFLSRGEIVERVNAPYVELFDSLQAFWCVGRGPYSYFRKTDEEAYNMASYAYRWRPREIGAAIQGHSAELAFCQELDIQPENGFFAWTRTVPIMVETYPEALKEWLWRKSQPKTSFTPR